MNQIRPEQNSSHKTLRGSRPGLAWLIATWGRLIIGLALAGAGGALYAHARTQAGGSSPWVGVTALAIGAILTLSAVYAIYLRTRPLHLLVPHGTPARPEPAIPMLGALLVYKFQALTEEQLQQALDQQRREAPNKRRIGEILLDLGFISAAELQRALDYQRAQAGAQEAPRDQTRENSRPGSQTAV